MAAKAGSGQNPHSDPRLQSSKTGCSAPAAGRCLDCNWPGGVVERAGATERGAAARLVAPHPDRQYRAAHVPRPDQSLWRRARRAGRPTRSRPPRPRIGAGAHLLARGRRGRIEGGACARRRLRRARRAGLSGAPANDRRRATFAGGAWKVGRVGTAAGRNRRLAQCFGGRGQIRRAAGARSRRGWFRYRIGAGARHRCRRASRQSFDRHHRGAGRRS
jgi:hypothetical protein